MLLPPHKIREIIEEAQFTDELSEIEPNSIRADEFIDGAKWVLSREPQTGMQIGPYVWFLPMWVPSGKPLVLY